MRFELFLAMRYLKAKRRQAVVGLVTLISVAGVAAGVAALIIALAITNGMRRDLQDRLLGNSAHVELMRIKADGIRDWQPLVDRLRRLPHVTAAAPGMYEQVMVSNGPRAQFALLKAIIPAQERTVSDLLGMLTSGSAADLAPAESTVGSHTAAIPPLVLGKDLADVVGASVGDTVMVTSPQGELTPMGLIPRYQPFRVAGIFRSGFYQYDSGMGFVRLSDAQRLFAEPDVITIISFKIDNLYDAQLRGQEIEQAAGKGFQATNWMETNRELFRALALEKIVTFIIIALIVLVAALNILIALTMMVMEKTRDIAVMMSFGVQPGPAHQPARHGGRAGHRLPRLLGGRPLPFHPALRLDLQHRHTSLRLKLDRRRTGLSRLHRSIAAGHALSLLRSRQSPPRSGAALRVDAL